MKLPYSKVKEKILSLKRALAPPTAPRVLPGGGGWCARSLRAQPCRRFDLRVVGIRGQRFDGVRATAPQHHSTTAPQHDSIRLLSHSSTPPRSFPVFTAQFSLLCSS